MKATALCRLVPVLVVALAIGAAGNSLAAEYVMAAGETLRLTDANIGNYADGIDLNGANCLLELDTSAAPSIRLRSSNYNQKAIIRKVNNSDWTITTGQPNYWGVYDIQGGVVTVNAASAFGYIWGECATCVYATNGNTTVVMPAIYTQRSRRIVVSGTGVDNRGVIEYGANLDNTAMQYIRLAGDALVKSTGSYYYFLKDLDPAGHTLTFDSAGGWLYGYGVLGAGRLNLVNRTIYGPRASDAGISEDVTGTISLSGNAGIRFLADVPRIVRPIEVGDNGHVHARLDNAVESSLFSTNHFTFTEPVTFTGETGEFVLNSRNPGEQMSFLGPITGAGSVRVDTGDYYHNGRIYLGHPSNTFSGGFTIRAQGTARGSVLAAYPGSLGGNGSSYANITAKESGNIECELADDGSKWDLAHFAKLVNEANWTGSGTPRLYTSNCTVMPELGASGVQAMTNKWGTTGDVALRFDSAEDSDDFAMYFGRIHLRSSAAFTLRNLKMYGGRYEDSIRQRIPNAVFIDSGDVVEVGTNMLRIVNNQMNEAVDAVRVVVSNATIKTSCAVLPDKYDTPRHCALAVGASRQWHLGILEVREGAVISNKLVVCCSDADDNGNNCFARGAVCQYGGDVYSLGGTADSHKDCGIGQSAYGAGSYDMYGGRFKAFGNFAIGYYNDGVWSQYGGTAEFLQRPGGTTVAHYISASSRHGLLNLRGGTMRFEGRLILSAGYQYASHAHLVADGPATRLTVEGVISANSNSDTIKPSFIEVNNGAVLEANQIGQPVISQHTRERQRLHVAFDGGTLKTRQASKKIFYSGADAPNSVTVYGGGMTVDTDGNDGNSIDVEITGATGSGVASVDMTTPTFVGSDWKMHVAGTPYVLIDGDGCGATAVPVWDPVACDVTNILVTAPGVGYSVATANVCYVNESIRLSYPCVIAANATTGSFTKKGEGALSLKATNSWGGATIVAGGTLKAAVDRAIPDNADVILSGGGVLDLDNREFTVHSVTYGPGGGSIVNASRATVPDAASMVISVEEIVAGKPIVISGDVDYADFTLTITGDVSALDPEVRRRHHVVRVSGGAATGNLVINSPDLPEGWSYRVDGRGVMLLNPMGTIINIH